MVKCRRIGSSNPLGEGECCVMMRRQGVPHVCDGPVCSALQGEASSPSPWQLQFFYPEHKG